MFEKRPFYLNGLFLRMRGAEKVFPVLGEIVYI